AVVLLDGLIASAVPDVLVPHAGRLRLVVLVHMPLGDETLELGHEALDVRCREREALVAAAAVVTTSEWSRRRLLDLYALPANQIHVATPGVDHAPLATGSASGTQLLCVAAVTRHKGYDVLAQALAMVADLPWTCTCVGTLTRDPGFVDSVRRQTDWYGLGDRV